MSSEISRQEVLQDNQGVEDIIAWVDGGVAEETIAADADTKNFLKSVETSKAKGDELAEEIRSEPDLVKRAKALVGANLMNFIETRRVKNGDELIKQAVSTDTNRWAAFSCLFGSGPARPHLNLFRGRCVDHTGAIFDEFTDVTALVLALDALGLKTQSARAVRESYREWCLSVRRNDQIELMDRIIPVWDGKTRLDTLLIDLFKPFDTDLNRKLSRYFFASLYMRIMNPGCLAPVVVSLIGGQNAGKSYIGKLICETLMNNPHADSTQLDLSADYTDFLRSITGESIVCNIGEMAGFTRGDMQKINNLITRTHDKFSYKFEGHISQPRSWVMLMDSNRYDGLQRDEMGNRRFAPLFCCQLPDVDGKPQWKEDFKADFSNFKVDLLQVMAEAKVWAEKLGAKGWVDFVNGVSKEVYDFNKAERTSDRGTIQDAQLENRFGDCLLKCKKSLPKERKGPQRTGVAIYKRDFGECYLTESRGKEPNWKHVDTKMIAMGAEIRKMTANRPAYFFPGFDSINAFIAKFKTGSDDWEEGETITPTAEEIEELESF